MLFHLAGTAAAAHADIFQAAAEPGHFMSLKVTETDKYICIHNRFSDFCFFYKFSALHRNAHVICSLQAVADNNMTAGGQQVKSIFVCSAQMFKSILPPPHKTYGIQEKRLLTLFDYIYCLSKEGDARKGMEKSYRSYVSTPLGQQGYSSFLHLVLEAKGKGAVLFHCADGKDRAGIACYLLLKTLGVKDETILEDYLLTNLSCKDKMAERRRHLLSYGVEEPLLSSSVMLAGVQENWLKAAMDEIETQYGGFDAYRRDKLHFSDAEQRRLQDIYLENED